MNGTNPEATTTAASGGNAAAATAPKRRRRATVAPLAMPEQPPKTAEERAQDAETLRRLQDITARLERRNLAIAVALAQQAAAGRGPLVEHFQELGRRFGHLLDAPQKPTLRVVPGGKVAP